MHNIEEWMEGKSKLIFALCTTERASLDMKTAGIGAGSGSGGVVPITDAAYITENNILLSNASHFFL